jgi:hypothetical protein
MCYAPRVMLRGRRSCAISERPTPSSALRPLATSHPPLATALLSPLFPLHPRNSPVTPLFPLHTQKRGGTPSSDMTNRSISEFSPTRLPHPSTAIFLRRFLFRPPLPLCALRVLCGESSFFSGLSSPNCQILSENAKNANITLRLSITLSNNVGAPTFLPRERTTENQQLIDRGTVFSSHCGLSTANCFSPLTPIIPVHARHSTVSPIIPVHTQKQGEGVPPTQNARACNSFVFFDHVNSVINYMSNYIVGAPTFVILHPNKKSQNPPASEGGPYTGNSKAGWRGARSR